MAVRLLLLAIIVLALFTSCAKPKYLVKGLTLPPGSSVVSEMTGKHDMGSMPFPMPGGGEVDKSVTVMFNCSGGWSGAASHIDGCMRSAGYTETMESLGQMAGKDMPDLGGMDLGNMMKMYSKPGGKFYVMLMNNSATASMAGAGAAMQGLGDFTLTVMEFKGD